MSPYRYKPDHIFEFESPERRAEMPPELIVSRIEIRPNEAVADIGAGTGYIAIHVAKNYPKARVFAVDSQREMIEYMENKMQVYELRNFNIFHTPAHATRLKTGGIHHAFMVNLLHDVDERDDVMGEFDRILVPKGDITIVEAKKGEGRPGPRQDERLAPDEVMEIMEASGAFKLEARYEDHERWYQMVFRRK